MSPGKVGPLVSALADGVRDDLASISDALGRARAMVTELGKVSQAINGLSDSCRGWASHLEELERQVEKESRETVSKLLGTPLNPIVSTVDPEHTAKVLEARKAT